MRKCLILLLLLILVGSFFMWQGIYLPKNAELTEKFLFSIKEGESAFKIAQNLEKEGLIKNALFFQIYVILKREYKDLKAGEYLLSPSMNIVEIVDKIIKGETLRLRVTIPEGFTLKQIQEKLSDVTRTAFVTLRVGDFKEDFSFLEDVPDTANLEGFLFPDTYQFTYGASVEEIVRKMLNNFDEKVSEDLRKEIQRQKKSIFEIIIMASMLEKEVKTFEDRKIVSGILWKRLKAGIPLQVDATITYVTGKKTIKIPKEDLEIDSPYNTYKYLGLPKGPICNPGLKSILASVYPKDSEYLYYLSTPEGETIFSKTLEEHNLAKAKYLK